MNPDWSQNKSAPKKAKMSKAVMSAKDPGFPEKPAFPKAELPGKGQSRDRSSGMGRKAKANPKAIGL